MEAQFDALEQRICAAISALDATQSSHFAALEAQLCTRLGTLLSDRLDYALPKNSPRRASFEKRSRHSGSVNHRLSSCKLKSQPCTTCTAQQHQRNSSALPIIPGDEPSTERRASDCAARWRSPSPPSIETDDDVLCKRVSSAMSSDGEAIASVSKGILNRGLDIVAARGGVSRRHFIGDLSRSPCWSRPYDVGEQRRTPNGRRHMTEFPKLLGTSSSQNNSLKTCGAAVASVDVEPVISESHVCTMQDSASGGIIETVTPGEDLDECISNEEAGWIAEEVSEHTVLSRLAKNSQEIPHASLRSSAVCLGQSFRRPEIRRSGAINLADVHHSTCYARAASAVKSPFYGYIVCIMLLANALTIGLEVNATAVNSDHAASTHFRISEVCFCILFTIELALRIAVHRKAFFKSPGWSWNVFDLCMVCLQLAELLMAAATAVSNVGSSAPVMGNGWVGKLARGLQLLRIIRVLRIVHFIRDLNILVYLICASLWSFLWTVVLLGLLTYMLGVFVTQLIVEHGKHDAASVAAGTKLHQYFGSIMTSVVSLFQAISGGIDWAELVTPLASTISPALLPLFSLYVAFAVLVILNLVTGVFVEGARKLTEQDRERELIQKAQKLFIQTDADDTGLITWGEFRAQLDGKAMQELLTDIDLGLCKPEDFFWLLDHGNAGQINADEFVRGGVQLGRPARTIDMAMVLREMQEMSMWLRHHFCGLERRLAEDSMNTASSFASIGHRGTFITDDIARTPSNTSNEPTMPMQLPRLMRRTTINVGRSSTTKLN